MAFLAATFAGCAQTEPLRTWPVQGILRQPDGGPVTSGALRFQNDADLRSIVVAELASDGAFEVTTLRDGRQQRGAADGVYRVVYLPSQGDPPSEWPVVLGEEVTIEPRDNRLSLTLPVKNSSRGSDKRPRR